MIKDVNTIGQLIKQRRKDLGLTQKTLAGLCGVGNRFITDLEKGKPTIEMGKVLHVMQMLGLTLLIKDQNHG